MDFAAGFLVWESCGDLSPMACSLIAGPDGLRARTVRRAGPLRAWSRRAAGDRLCAGLPGERLTSMFGVLGAQLPWWVAGPGVGLCVVALYGLINARLGVSGAWLAAIAPVEGWKPEPWRRTFLLALA